MIDERLGTKFAKNEGLKTIGLLGVLVEAKNQSIISEIRPILLQLEANGFYLGNQLKSRVLAQVRE